MLGSRALKRWTRRYPRARPLRNLRRPLLATGGAVFGLGLARGLFELDPVRLVLLSTWPGALSLAALLAVLGVAAGRGRIREVWPPKQSGPAQWAGLALLLPLAAVLAPDTNPLRTLTLLGGSLVLFIFLAFSERPALAIWPAQPMPGRGLSPIPRRAAGISVLLSLSLFVSLLCLYLAGVAPAVGEADTFEFQVGIARLGIAHGSGYPLLMLVGRLFASLPIGGTLAFRANLTSAFFGALAGVLVERLARRLGATPLAALLAGFAFGVSPTLWSRAVEVEAYTLNACLVGALMLLSLRLAQPAPEPGATRRDLYVLALLFGLSLTNHLTTLLLGPAAALAAFIALRRLRTARVRLVGQMAALLALGLSVYLYVPVRWPAVNNGEQMSLRQFANILSGSEARGAFQWDLPLRDAGRLGIAWHKIAGEYGWAGLALAVAGLGVLAWKDLIPYLPSLKGKGVVLANRGGGEGPANAPEGLHGGGGRQGLRADFLLVVLAYAAYFYFALAFNVPDPDFSAFFIPLHLLTAVLMGVGMQALLNVGRADQRPGRAGRPVRIQRERLTLAGGRSVEVLATDLPAPRRPGRPAVVIALVGFALLPLGSVWQTLPAVDKSKDWDRQRLGELMLAQPLATGATILADSQKIAPLYYLQVAEGVRPDLDILVLPDEASYRAVLDVRLAAGKTVYLGRYLPGLGAAYSLRSIGPLAEVRLEPATQANVALTEPAGQPAAPGVDWLGFAAPEGLRGAAPGSVPLTLAWRASARPDANWLVHLRIVDASGGVAWQSAGSVPVSGLYPTNAWRPGEVVTDFYLLPIAHTLAPGEYKLEVGLFPPFAATDEAGWAELGPLTVLPPVDPPTPPRQLRARFGPQWLLGYGLPETAPAGAGVPVTLYWLRAPAAGRVTALGEDRSLAGWSEGTLAPLVYRLTAPETAATLDVYITTGQPAHCGWLAPPSAGCALPAVKVAGQAADGAANFDNLIVLRQVELQTTRTTPGGEAALTLEWQGLQTMTQDFTVFVHVLGPDGQVHGQVDAWPVSGTRATSGWAPGEVIRDPYRVRVAGDAPVGAYQVEIGLYSLATGQRLQVLNADGQPIDDRVLVPGLSVVEP